MVCTTVTSIIYWKATWHKSSHLNRVSQEAVDVVLICHRREPQPALLPLVGRVERGDLRHAVVVSGVLKGVNSFNLNIFVG